MTSHERRATWPQTGEEIVVRKEINNTVDSACLPVLRAVNECPNPVSHTNISQQTNISRQAVSTHIAALQEREAIKSDNEGVKPTAGGKLLLEVIEKYLQTVTGEDSVEEEVEEAIEELSYLTRSVHPHATLSELATQPQRLSELQRTVISSPSNPTVRRIIERFEENSWCQINNNKRQVTSDGRRVLNAYEDLERSVKQLIEKAPWFQRLSPDDATVPIQALADAELVVADPDRPAEVLSMALKLIDIRLSRFRTLCCIYHTVLFNSYRVLLEAGVEAECIHDWPTHREASNNPGTQYAVDDSMYENYQPFVLDYAHTLGIGIYDDRKVAIGAYNRSGKGNHIAMIISTNDNLVDWGINLYESYRADAQPVSEVTTE